AVSPGTNIGGLRRRTIAPATGAVQQDGRTHKGGLCWVAVARCDGWYLRNFLDMGNTMKRLIIAGLALLLLQPALAQTPTADDVAALTKRVEKLEATRAVKKL